MVLKQQLTGININQIFLPLMESVVTPLTKIVSIPLRLPAKISPAEASIQKKIYGSCAIALIISNEEMEEKIKIVKSLEESKLLIKLYTETIKYEAMLLETRKCIARKRSNKSM